MRLALRGILVLLPALVIGYSSVFTVYQTDQTIVLRLGEPRRTITEPGLYFKLPFLDSLIHIDRRILDLENPVQEIIASDEKRLVVYAFARYRISDALKFYQSIGAIEDANSRLSALLNSTLRRVLGQATTTTIVRDRRAELMASVREQFEAEARSFGVSVVDVRIRRADLPEQNRQAVYRRMQTERERQAVGFRALGYQHGQEIRAKADRDVTILIAKAVAQGDQTRGEGDAVRNRIFAAAYGRDPEFFSFYRSMQAYEAAFSGSDTRMVMTPRSSFFRYFRDPMGGAARVATPPDRDEQGE